MKIITWTFLLVLLNMSLAIAQEKIQVVTKTINRTFDLSSEESLKIVAEKASIKVWGWNRDEVKLVMKLTAKHPERRVAEKDLTALRYQIETDGSHKLIKNYFLISEGISDLDSKLQAEYELWVPHHRTVTISNRYGNIAVEEWFATLDIMAEFGEVSLDNVVGDIKLNIAYGDVITHHTEGKLSGTSRKSNLQFYDVKGAISLETNYGEVSITTQDQLKALDINASRTKITFATLDPMRYAYQLATSCESIYVSIPGKWDFGTDLDCKRLFVSYATDLSLIHIKTSFSPITINYLKNEEMRSTHRP